MYIDERLKFDTEHSGAENKEKGPIILKPSNKSVKKLDLP